MKNGQSDLVLENGVTGEHAIWIFNQGVLDHTITLQTLSGGWHIVGAGDFNGDGYRRPGLGEFHHWWSRHLASHLMLCSARFIQNAPPMISRCLILAHGQHVLTGDWQALDRVLNLLQSRSLLVNGVYSSSVNLPTVPPMWHIAGVGDFLGNGQPDLVWENILSGARSIWLLKNGVYSSSIDLPVVSTLWHIAGAADFNSDGQADLIWENVFSGAHMIWLLKNGVYSSSITLPAVSTQWQIEDH